MFMSSDSIQSVFEEFISYTWSMVHGPCPVIISDSGQNKLYTYIYISSHLCYLPKVVSISRHGVSDVSMGTTPYILATRKLII